MIVQSQQSSASAPFYPDFLGRNSTVSLFEKLDQRQVAVGVSRSPGEFAILEACSLGAARPHRDEHLTIFSYSFAAGTNFKFCNVLHIKQFTCTDPNRLHWWHPIGISSRTRLPRSINGWKKPRSPPWNPWPSPSSPGLSPYSCWVGRGPAGYQPGNSSNTRIWSNYWRFHNQKWSFTMKQIGVEDPENCSFDLKPWMYIEIHTVLNSLDMFLSRIYLPESKSSLPRLPHLPTKNPAFCRCCLRCNFHASIFQPACQASSKSPFFFTI